MQSKANPTRSTRSTRTDKPNTADASDAVILAASTIRRALKEACVESTGKRPGQGAEAEYPRDEAIEAVRAYLEKKNKT